MAFKPGGIKPPNSGRRKGSGNKLTFDVKAALLPHGPALARELVEIALTCKNQAVKVLAIRECLDRLTGKATQPVEGQITHGISRQLQTLLQQHDGNSRSVPVRNGGTLIEHDAADGDETNGNNGNSELH